MFCYIIGMFVYMVVDNNDFCEEIFDGKNIRVISMDYFQKCEYLVIIFKKEDFWIY